MAKRKHQIGTLFHQAKIQELEILEQRAQGGWCCVGYVVMHGGSMVLWQALQRLRGSGNHGAHALLTGGRAQGRCLCGAAARAGHATKTATRNKYGW